MLGVIKYDARILGERDAVPRLVMYAAPIIAMSRTYEEDCTADERWNGLLFDWPVLEFEARECV